MFSSPNEFSLFIETKVAKDPTMTHVDAIVKYCADNMLDPEDVKPLINKSLKAKLKNDFTEMKFLKKEKTTQLL